MTITHSLSVTRNEK